MNRTHLGDNVGFCFSHDTFASPRCIASTDPGLGCAPFGP